MSTRLTDTDENNELGKILQVGNGAFEKLTSCEFVLILRMNNGWGFEKRLAFAVITTKKSRFLLKVLRFLASKAVKSSTLAFKGIHNVNCSNCHSSTPMFCKDLEDFMSLFIYKTTYSFYSTSACQSTNGGLCDNAKYFAVTLSPTLSKPFITFSSTIQEDMVIVKTCLLVLIALASILIQGEIHQKDLGNKPFLTQNEMDSLYNGRMCIPKLCGLAYGYIQSNLLFLSSQTSMRNDCIAISGVGDIKCLPFTNHVVKLELPIDIKKSLPGTLKLSFIKTDTGSIHSSAYYIRKMQTLPQLDEFIHIFQPSYGKFIYRKLRVDFELQYVDIINTTSTTKLKANEIAIDIVGSPLTNIQSFGISSSYLETGSIEPGSCFFTLLPVSSGHEDLNLPPVPVSGWMAHGYVESLLTVEEIQTYRRIVQRAAKTFNVTSESPSSSTSSSSTTTTMTTSFSWSLLPLPYGGQLPQIQPTSSVCFWSGERMDGQRQIWLQQTRAMNKEKFVFTWILDSSQSNANTNTNTTSSTSVLRNHLSQIPLVRSDYNRYSDFEEASSDPITAEFLTQFTDLYNINSNSNSNNNMMNEFIRFVASRLRASNYSIDEIQPYWAREIYQTMRDFLLRENCDVIVYGNNRHYGADVFTVDTAKIIGVPTVTELVNLFVHPEVIPSVIVAPSHFAIEHESIRHIVTSELFPVKPVLIVISPGVDMKRFYPLETSVAANKSTDTDTDTDTDSRYRQLFCGFVSSYQDDKTPCFVVGFIARLSPEKSPGLFLMTAHELLQLNPFMRFVMVGDGDLMSHLETLCDMLNIRSSVHFTGWASEELPHLLRSMDVVVNPSLRAVSETFCIANIEAMASGVPLVTFGVGGVGEYIEQANHQGNAKGEGEGEWSSVQAVDNVVLVNEASPLALAHAVQLLMDDEELRKHIGNRGRQTILSYFTLERQMKQYEDLYISLALGA
eukprot:gene2333-4537_t